MTPQRPRQRLYLITPLLGDTDAFASVIGDCLQAGDIAAVLLRLEGGNERVLVNRAKAIAAIVQRHDVALLLDGHPDFVGRAGADGAHLTGIDELTAAIGALKPERIAGVGGLRSRHDAMLAGETGADYVLFGEPDPAPSAPLSEDWQGEDGRPPFETILERLSWWADIFELPCVGYAASLDEVAPLAQAGADFVALGDWIWTQPQGPATVIAAASHCLTALSSPA